MFKDDIDLVTEKVAQYGLQLPALDAGGLAFPVVADYDITIRTGNQHARYLNLPEPPFTHVFGEYAITNPDGTDQPPIEKMPERDKWGTVVCLSTLEHVENPFEVFNGLYRILQPGGLLILSTVQSFPYHPSWNKDRTRIDYPDNWRFTPSGLKILAQHSGFEILECEWRLQINADMGIKEIHTGVSQEIISTYIVARKPNSEK